MSSRATLPAIAACVSAVLLLALVQQAVGNPHGGYKAGTSLCLACHTLHSAKGSPILSNPTQTDVCYSCHDGTGSTREVLSSFGHGGEGGQGSRHPVPEGSLACLSCHTPHAGPSEGNPMSLASGESRESTGTAVCGACHGSGSSLPGGDLATPADVSAHGTEVVSDSAADISCKACHEVHGSSNGSLLRPVLARSDGTTVTVAGSRDLCVGCHTSALPAYPGDSVALTSPHSENTSSTKAATTYPSSGAKPGECVNCHEPHGTPGQPDFLRASKDDICADCHDAEGVERPSGYSYAGASAMDSSAHSAVETGVAGASVSFGSGDFEAWESATEPTPSSPGTPITAARLEGLRRNDAQYLSTRLASVTGTNDYQTYRFEAPGLKEDVRDITLKWRGYGEEVSGNPVALSAWDWTAAGGAGAWNQIASQQMTNPTTLELKLDPSRHVSVEGEVYVMAKARNHNDAEIVSGPTITSSGSSAQFTWTTSGLTNGWLEYGPTVAYGSLAGSASRTTWHNVTVNNLLPGAYHYRVTSESRDGESVTTPDARFGVPAATLTPVPGYPGATSADVTFQWSTPLEARRPFDYRVRIWRWDWVAWDYYVIHESPWLADINQYTRTLPGGYWYQWTVEARDYEGVSFGAPAPQEFEVGDGGTGSCPMLFTNTEDGVQMESDLLGAGKLGLRTKNGYVPPEPQEVYVLKHEPADVDGAWDLRFVEERYEADYLDEVGLYVADLPEGLELYAEKPQADGSWSGGIEPALHTVSADARTPEGVTHVQTGQDVTDLLRENDDTYLVLNEDRNVGFEYQTLELDLGHTRGAPQTKVVMDAMSAFPDTAAGTDRAASFGARTKIEVQDSEGDWVVVPSSKVVLPKPPEFSRPYVFDISNIWVGDSRRVRFTFLFKTYVDWLVVDTTADVDLELTRAPLLSSDLRQRGMDPRTGNGEIFGYAYGEPTGITRYFEGAHTRLGDVSPLLYTVDDRFVVFGGGDELALRFEALPHPPEGTRRHWVLGATGYYKNAKIEPPFAVEPLPFAAMSNYPFAEDERYPDSAGRGAYADEWNTRVYAGSGGMATGSATTTAEAVVETGGELRGEGMWLARVWRAFVALFDEAGREGSVAGDQREVLHRSLNTDFVGLQAAYVGAAAEGTCSACHAVHGQAVDGVEDPALLWSTEDRLCTAVGTGCHSDAANSASGRDIEAEFTAGSDARTHHDIFQAQQRASGARIDCSDCHNPHIATAESEIVDPDDASSPVSASFAPYLDESRYIYLAVGAEHDAVPPVISNRWIDINYAGWEQPVIRWTTNESADSWVEYGTTTAYELGSVGNGSYSTAHAVSMPALTPGVTYYMRVRTTDAPGNETLSAGFTYVPAAPPPAPVLKPSADITTTANTVTPLLEWNAVASPDGDPVEYFAEVSLQGGSPLAQSGWITSTSWTTPELNAWNNPTYVWRVRARDATHTVAVSPWSLSDSFFIDGPVESCPNLFTWNGEEFTFVTDVMGLGPLAVKKGKDVYLDPEPVEDTVIPPGSLVAREGSLDIHLTDERHEIEYIDEVGLAAVDHPTGTRLLTNDLHWGAFDGGREPTRYFTIRDPKPVRATYERLPVLGTETVPPTDVTADLAEEGDGEIVYSGVYDDNVWTFDLGELGDPERVKLVVSGWVGYANKREKAEWVASGKRPPPSYIEVQNAQGEWVRVGDAPHPPGYPKTVVYDLTDAFPADVMDYKVRMRIYMRMNLDYVGVDTSPDEAVVTTDLSPRSASLSFKGVSQYEEAPYPRYVYDEIANPSPLQQTGSFTRFGDVTELVLDADDRFVIMDTGDDLALSFDEPSAPAAGLTRTYVIHTDGYHDTQTGAVEPLPFHAMSGYPYPEDEHYPDDALHTTYLQEWNTRHKPSAAEEDLVESGTIARIRSLVASLWKRVLLAFESTERPAAETRMADRSSPMEAHAARLAMASESAAEETEPPGHYSINTDMIRVSGDRSGASLQTYAPQQGWASVGSSLPPVPSAPGTPVDAGALTAASSVDSQRWTTDDATLDREWNWQVVRVQLPESDLGLLKTLRFEWRGYGEPTAGYATKFAVWDFSSGSWKTIGSAMAAGTPRSYMRIETAIPNSFCLRCHDGSPPPGVIFPPGVQNIAAYWGLGGSSDGHGPRAGTGGTGGLAQGLVRGMTELPCVTCHEVHGNANLYHIAESANGADGIVATNGNAVKSLCAACHTGTVDTWHGECASCHSLPSHGAEFIDSPESNGVYYGGYPNASSNCLLCHNHGSKSSVGSDYGRGVSDVQQAEDNPDTDCHPCHNYNTTF